MGSNFANFHAGCHGPVPLETQLLRGCRSLTKTPGDAKATLLLLLLEGGAFPRGLPAFLLAHGAISLRKTARKGGVTLSSVRYSLFVCDAPAMCQPAGALTTIWPNGNVGITTWSGSNAIRGGSARNATISLVALSETRSSR